MKKRVIALLLAATMLSLTACGGGNNAATDNTQTADGAATDNAGDTQTADGAATDNAGDTQTADAAADTTSAGGKILSVQVGPDPETIDPALNSAVDGGNMLLHSYECLLTVDQEGKLAPGQAESWETSEDGLTWTFHLRDGLKWSDGSEIGRASCRERV